MKKATLMGGLRHEVEKIEREERFCVSKTNEHLWVQERSPLLVIEKNPTPEVLERRICPCHVGADTIQTSNRWYEQKRLHSHMPIPKVMEPGTRRLYASHCDARSRRYERKITVPSLSHHSLLEVAT